MLRVPTKPMFAAYFSAFCNKAQLFSQPFLKTATTKLTEKSIDRFVRSADFNVLDLLIPSRLLVLVIGTNWLSQVRYINYLVLS